MHQREEGREGFARHGDNRITFVVYELDVIVIGRLRSKPFQIQRERADLESALRTVVQRRGGSTPKHADGAVRRQRMRRPGGDDKPRHRRIGTVNMRHSDIAGAWQDFFFGFLVLVHIE